MSQLSLRALHGEQNYVFNVIPNGLTPVGEPAAVPA